MTAPSFSSRPFLPVRDSALNENSWDALLDGNNGFIIQDPAKEWSISCVNSRPEGVRRRDSHNLGTTL